MTLLLSVIFIFFSCKSTPDLAPVDAFDLLSTDAALYMTVPVQANQEFAASAIQKVAKVAESDAKKIIERLDFAYISIDSKNELQLSAGGNIPTTLAGLALTEKNGWTAGAVENQAVYTQKQTAYQLCLPSSSNAFLSRDISPMAKKFNQIAYGGGEKKSAENDLSATVSENREKLLSETLDAYQFKFLHENLGADIMLYSPNPPVFLRNFLGGVEVGVPVSSLYAKLSKYEEYSGGFNVTLVLNLNDARTIKAVAASMKLAFFPIAVKIEQTGEKQLTITDLPVSQRQLLSMIK